MSLSFSKLSFFLLLFLSSLSLVSATPFIVGIANNANDTTSANDRIAVLWNPAVGESDNVTDVIGVNGNSGTDNLYLIDCALLSNGCSVGTTIRVKIISGNDYYNSAYVESTITGAGFQQMPNITLNVPPGVNLSSPDQYSNLSSPVSFFCNASDIDGNLANVTLYGNWSGSWQAEGVNQTKGSSSNVSILSSTITDGLYSWSCLVTDSVRSSKFASINRTLIIDSTPPNIYSIGYNLTNPICGNISNVIVNCTTNDSLSTVYSVEIRSYPPNGGFFDTSATLISGQTFGANILLNYTGEWNFGCVSTDFANNVNITNSSAHLNVYSNNSDLILLSSAITFSPINPVESQATIVNATIWNNACSPANNFLVGFFLGNPLSNGQQIGSNITVSVPGVTNVSVNLTWSAAIGITSFFVFADVSDLISETNETNNLASKNITVSAWQQFYGNVTIDKILSSSNLFNLSFWANSTSLSGNIFISDTESLIHWASLLAIGRNLSGGVVTNDFTNIDSILSMGALNDSISNIFTSNGINPRSTANITVFQRPIFNVPMVSSINNTSFSTGILWDSSDDTNGEYDVVDKEDLVFVAGVNKSKVGAYGQYDYEIKIPARLRQYQTLDSSNVYLYFDIN